MNTVTTCVSLPSEKRSETQLQLKLHSPETKKLQTIVTPNILQILEFQNNLKIIDFANSLINNNTCRQVAFFVDLIFVGQKIRALLDSGSSKSFLGQSVIQLIKDKGLTTKPIPVRRVTVANGNVFKIERAIDIEIQLINRNFQVNFFLMPVLSYSCVLGLDFLIQAGLIVDFAANSLHYRDPKVTFTFIPENSTDRVTVCNELQLLSEEQTEILKKFLYERIPPPPDKLPITPLAQHDIDIGDHQPIRQKAYAMTPIKLEALWNETDEWLRQDIIEPSQADWASPPVLTKKADGKWRPCIDYRRVNSCTKKMLIPFQT